MSPNKRVKIYTAEDVQNHKSLSSCWVTRGGKVYDVSAFLPDHPGGDDIILKYAGQDIQKAMKDPEEHDHSDSAYDMMEEYLIGRLGNNANIVDESGSISTGELPTVNTFVYRLGSPG
jgi:4-hydroxysphinganine ceramide fatty acyl 2-hydroxylase